MERGNVAYQEQGTPQGGVISPLLSNIYLHEVLDGWFVNEVQPRMKGRAFMVRYADDQETVEQVDTGDNALVPEEPGQKQGGTAQRTVREAEGVRILRHNVQLQKP
jgi:hypothetical protein